MIAEPDSGFRRNDEKIGGTPDPIN
jgi:hypothetical protein